MLRLFKTKDTRRQDDENSLHEAAATGNIPLLNKMLAAGVNTECRIDDDTALLAAVNYKQYAAVKILLAHQANLMATNKFGLNALALAAYSGQIEVAKLLLDAGADINTRTDRYASNYFADKTPLELAVMNKQTEMIALLKSHSAQTNDKANMKAHCHRHHR